MDLVVKNEVEDNHRETASPATGYPAPAVEADLQHDLHLSLTPKPLTFTLRRRRKKLSIDRKEEKLKIKKCLSETIIKHAVAGHRGKRKSCKKNNATVDGKCTYGEAKSPAMTRAEEVQSNLETDFPSFAKSMVRSHVASCFWMGLPGQFCKLHLPNKDTTITLEDESGKEYDTKYIADKTGLSAGWRQFVSGHNLLEGDVLVFQLVKPTKFKVYIIRANDFTEVDGALGLLNLDAHTKSESELGDAPCKSVKRRKHQRSLPLAIVQKRNKNSGRPQLAPNLDHPAEQSENDSEEVRSEVLEGFKLSVPGVQFSEIKGFENFSIVIDGLVADSELPENIQNKYYKLCCCQNAFLHENLIQGINYKLIVGIICETVNIADDLRTCNFTTSRDEFAMWDRTLQAFELLGMNVGFLRARLQRLVSLAYESEGSTDTRRYIEVKTERACTEDEIKRLEAKLVKLKGDYERFGAKVESLKSKAESHALKFQEEVSSPW